MNQEGNDEGHLRKYLLGELEEAEQQALEEQLLKEDELFALLLAEEDELVDDYLGGGLSGDERPRFESFFLSTPERQRKLSFAMALRRYVTTEAMASTVASRVVSHRSLAWMQTFSNPYFKLAAAAALVLGVGLGIWRVFFYQSEVAKGMAALARAYRTERPVEARISGLGYAPFPNTRGGELTKADSVSLKRAELILFDEFEKHPTAAVQHALGRLYLAEHKFDDAIAQFEKALKADPNNAQLHSDFGAALFENGRALQTDGNGRNVEAFARSLEHLNRALALDTKLHEALFDRALVHEKMMLIERAIDDWRAYIKGDPTGPWADEARQHLNRLEETQRQTGESQQNLIKDFLNACVARDAERAWALFSPNREKVITEMLSSYLKGAGEPASKSGRERLDALSYAGELDIRRVGDRYAADTARFYESAPAKKLAMAGEAREIMSQAHELYKQGRVAKSADLRDRARRRFAEIGDTCGERLATYWLALHYWELARTRESLSLLDPLLRACETDRYYWLYALALYQRATIAFKSDEYSKLTAYCEQIQQLAERVNNPKSALNAAVGFIEQYRLLGNQRECFQQISRSWPVVSATTLEPMSLWRYYNELSTAFNTFGFCDAAIAYACESLRFAASDQNFTMLSFSYAHLGLMYGKAQRFEEAFGTLERAYDIPAAHADESLGQLMMAYATAQIGHLYRVRGEFAEARQRYDHAVKLHERYGLDFPTHLYEAYKGRLACSITLHDTAAAQQQLTTLLELMDRHRANIFEQENRDSFFDAEQSVYDVGIDLAGSQLEDWPKALEYAEASRARSLLDSINGITKVIDVGGRPDVLLPSTARPMSLTEIQARIPHHARLLEYAVLDEKLVVWVISRSDLQHVTVPVPQSELAEAVKRFLAALHGVSDADRVETEQLARELFTSLIAPAESLLGGCRGLIIAPDKILNLLPWDALKSPASNRFLLEDYIVTVAPSATLFALCSDLAVQKADKRDERVLSVGDPSFDRDAFAQLRNLPAAADEAEKIAALYHSRHLLVGAAAGESSVRNELGRVDVVHFALHCMVNPQSAMRSTLVLAKEPTNGLREPEIDGLLHAYEIHGLKLPRLRLAVLAACQTGVERYYRGEGMIGMARGFLVARVPLVVASLWPVDSENTAELMIRFHQYRKRDKMPTAEALWRAKRSLLQDPEVTHNQPRHWAAFQSIGGLTSF